MIDWPLVVAGLIAENTREALTADVVFAVWRDRAKPKGVGFLMLKGEDMMGEMEAARRPISSFDVSSVRVADEKEARVLLKMVRDAGNGGV